MYASTNTVVHSAPLKLLCTARLKADHDSQIQRLVLKLSQEQHARTDLEDRLDQALVGGKDVNILLVCCNLLFVLFVLSNAFGKIQTTPRGGDSSRRCSARLRPLETICTAHPEQL